MKPGDLLWESICSPWILACALLLSGALILGTLAWGIREWRTRIALGVPRMIALALLLLMMLQPREKKEEVTILKPQLAVLVDGSESMADAVDEKQPSRLQRLAEWFKSDAYAEAGRDFDLRMFRFDRNLEEVSGNPSQWKFKGTGSEVLKAVNQVQEKFRGQPLAGVLLLSDGIDTGGAERTIPVPTNVPVMSFELEKPFQPRQRERSLRIAGVDFAPKVVIDRESEIRASLTSAGMSGQVVQVQLLRDGKPVATVPVTFNEDFQTRSAAFSVTLPTAGPARFEVRVDDPAVDKGARSYPVLIEAMEPGNRVLYIQNSFGFDLKFLRKAIVSDRNLQLSTFVRLPAGRIAMIDGTGAQAASGYDFSPKSLGNTSVVILGDLSPSALTDENAKALRDFVDHGGGLVLLGGSELFTSRTVGSTPLGGLFPVRLPAPYVEGKFPVKMTDSGLHHPVFGPLFSKVSDFPPLLSLNDCQGVAPAAEVLMQAMTGASSKPLVVAMRFGQGKVVAVMSNTLWRWRLATTRFTSGQSPYDAFWTQLMDWLIPKEQEKQSSDHLELFTERTGYILGEKPEIRAVLRTADPKPLPATIPLRVRTPDEKNFDYVMKSAQLTLPDGKTVKGYAAEIEPNVTGLFEATSSVTLGSNRVSGELRLPVSKPPSEITGKPIYRALLQRVSRESGGKFYPLGEWGGWARDFHYKEQKFSRIQLRDLWNSPVLLGLLLVFLCVEWTIRKLRNLP
jgi:Putative glutamine amidotransferase